MYISGKCGQLNNYNVKSVGVYKNTFIVFLKLDEYWNNSLQLSQHYKHIN
jgi:hypothetical protein